MRVDFHHPMFKWFSSSDIISSLFLSCLCTAKKLILMMCMLSQSPKKLQSIFEIDRLLSVCIMSKKKSNAYSQVFIDSMLCFSSNLFFKPIRRKLVKLRSLMWKIFVFFGNSSVYYFFGLNVFFRMMIIWPFRFFFFWNFNNLFWTLPKSIIVDLYWMYVCNSLCDFRYQTTTYFQSSVICFLFWYFGSCLLKK